MSKNLVNPRKDAARTLFMQYVPLAEIRERLDIPAPTLHHWVYGKDAESKKTAWNAQRKKQTTEIIEEIKAENINGLNKIYKLAIPLIHNNLVRMAKEGVKLNPRDLKSISEIIVNFDKIMRLESGDPTEIVSLTSQPITVEELKQVILKDKFLNILDIDAKEVNDGTSKDSPGHEGETKDSDGADRSDGRGEDGDSGTGDPLPTIHGATKPDPFS